MGNDNKKGSSTHVAPPVRPIEIKTYVMSCQTKMSLYRNKKVYEIKKISFFVEKSNNELI